MKRPAALLMTLLLAASAGAQTVWRCEGERTLYADAPCAGGQAVTVADPRTAEQLRDGQRAAAIDRELARRLVNERHEREWEQGGGLAGIRSAAPAPVKPAKTRMQKQSRRQPRSADDTWQASRRGSRSERG